MIPSDLELWAPEVNHISWIWFAWVNSCWHISRTLQAWHSIGYSKDWGLRGCVEILGNPIRYGAMNSSSQPCFMDLVWVGWFMVPCLPNLTTYGHETCTTGCSKDWSLKRCVEILWQPHQIWSYDPWIQHISWIWFGWVNSWAISPEPYGYETCTIGYSKD